MIDSSLIVSLLYRNFRDCTAFVKTRNAVNDELGVYQDVGLLVTRYVFYSQHIEFWSDPTLTRLRYDKLIGYERLSKTSVARTVMVHTVEESLAIPLSGALADGYAFVNFVKPIVCENLRNAELPQRIRGLFRHPVFGYRSDEHFTCLDTAMMTRMVR